MSREHRRRKKPSGRAMVRAAMRGPLRWLRAYPHRGAWHELGAPGEPIEDLPALDGHALSQATRAARTLVREAPDALTRQFGLSPSQWLACVTQRLDVLKRDTPEPPRWPPRAERHAAPLERAASRSLRQTATLARWVYGWHPDEAEQAMRRLGALAKHWPTELLSDQSETAVLWGLRVLQVAVEEGHRPGLRLLHALTGPVGPPLAPPPYPSTSKGRLKLPGRPSARLAREVLDSLTWALSDRDPKRRRLGVALVDGLRPRALAEAWTHWYAVYDALARAVRRERDDAAVPALREEVLAHRGKVPPIAAWAGWRHTLRRGLALPTPALALLVEGVETWPEYVAGMAPRAGLAALATDALVEHPRRGKKRAGALIKTSRRLLSLASAADAVAPWQAMLVGPNAPTGRTYRAVDSRLEDGAPKLAEAYYGAVRRWYEMDAARAAQGFRDHGLDRATFGLARRVPDADWVFDRGQALVTHVSASKLGHHALDAWLHFAHALTDDRDTFVALVKSLSEHELAADLDEDETPVASLATLPDQSRALLARMVLRGDPRAAMRIAGRRDALAALGAACPDLEVPVPARARPWMRIYPRLFRGPLRRLQAVDPDPRKTAEQILGRAFPRPEKLDSEIAALRQRMDQAPDPARLQVRLARQLERRRALDREPHTVEGMSDAKLLRLLGKLDQAADRHTFARWERTLSERLDAALGQKLRLSQVPSWLSEPPLTDLWPHLMQLDAGDRRLALRLLAVRTGPVPWDLRDAAPNRRFAERLAREGLDTAPWIDGPGVVRHEHARGEIFLQLERDPVEIFRMGHYFGTCLSPGDVNFFSTVANAADLNKRVLFARFEDGQVLGRCLLAITDTGKLLAFHPYCHHPDVDFRAMVLAFARELADAMGTELVHQGRVTRLVAKDWYDDGPIDLTGRFAKLERGGELEERLRVIAPLALRSLLDDVLGQGFVDARSFPLVATLVRNLGRDDLLPPLLEVATTIADLDRFTRESLLTAAWDAGATQEARRFYERHLRGSLRRHGVPTLFTTPRVLAEMGEASFALRLLRRSRPRGVEKDEEEMDADRLLAAAVAHLELRRHNKAQTLLTRAVTRFSRDPRAARWRRMLADLSMTTEA